MNEVNENAELTTLLAMALALRGKAAPGPDVANRHVIAEHAGLTIHFHDAIPACECCPPLSVSIWDDEAGESVFMGGVDPDNLSDAHCDEWQRGDWESRLKFLN